MGGGRKGWAGGLRTSRRQGHWTRRWFAASRTLLGTSRREGSGRCHAGRVLQPRRSRWHLSSRRRPLLCQRRLLCRSYASSIMASYGRRKTLYTRLARRHDLLLRIGVTSWCGTAGLGISDDEEYHESCYSLSPSDRGPVNE